MGSALAGKATAEAWAGAVTSEGKPSVFWTDGTGRIETDPDSGP